jgi:FkbM family methyltransferase
MRSRLRPLASAARRLRLRVTGSAWKHGAQRVGDLAWVVPEPGAGTGVTVRELDEQAWVVGKQGRRRDIHRLGPDVLRSHVLLDRRAANNRPHDLQKGLAQFATREHLRWILRLLDINCVIDVGANVGQYATQLRRDGYDGRIVSFEPLPSLAKILSRKAERDPGWIVHDCALGDEEAEAEIHARRGTMSSLLPASEFGRKWHPRLREESKEQIRIRRLDGLFDEAVSGLVEPRVYLKLDTQGYDLQAFRGAGRRLTEVLGMQSEVSCVPIYDGMPRIFEQIAAYEQAGFAISGMFPVSFHARSARAVEFDVLMVRPGAAVR